MFEAVKTSADTLRPTCLCKPCIRWMTAAPGRKRLCPELLSMNQGPQLMSMPARSRLNVPSGCVEAESATSRNPFMAITSLRCCRADIKGLDIHRTAGRNSQAAAGKYLRSNVVVYRMFCPSRRMWGRAALETGQDRRRGALQAGDEVLGRRAPSRRVVD